LAGRIGDWEGRAPTHAGEVALERATAETAGYELGSSARVISADGMRHVEVVGVTDLHTSMAGASIVLLDEATATAAVGLTGEYQYLQVYGAPDDEIKLAAAVTAALDPRSGAPAEGATVEVLTGQEMRDAQMAEVSTILGFISTFLLVFAAIALFVGGFIIVNTFTMTVRERQGEHALLRALGASPMQVFGLVVGEAAVVGAVGAALGVLAGVGLMQAIRALMVSNGMDLPQAFALTPGNLTVCLAVGVLVTAAAAAIPARRAAAVAPVEVMREHGGAAPTGPARAIRTLVGGILLGGGAAAAVAGVWNLESVSAPAVGLGAVAVTLGAILTAPALVGWITGVIGLPAKLIRPIGPLARGNVARNPKRSAATASALMIGVMIVAGASTLAASTAKSIEAFASNTLGADVVVADVAGRAFIPPDLNAEVSALPEVASVESLSWMPLRVGRPGEPGAVRDMTGMSPSALGREYLVTPREGSWEAWRAGEAVAVPDVLAQAEGWQVGELLTLTGETSEVTVPLGVVYDSVAETSLLAASSLWQQVGPSPTAAGPVMLMANAADGVTPEALDAAIAEVAAPYALFAVETADEFASTRAAQAQASVNILYALVALSVVIAAIGIVNTLALSLIERRREIGLLRAVGLGRTQLAATVTLESVLLAVFGAVAGAALGTGLAALLPRLLRSQGLVDLAIHWPSLGVIMVLAVVIGALAAIWPATRAARLPVLEAIHAS
jgi:putative ABC transport system permease protein